MSLGIGNWLPQYLCIRSVGTSCSHCPRFFLSASSSTIADCESCRLRSVSPHFKMLLSGRVKDYGTPVQHQSHLRCGCDELSVFVDSSYARFVSLCCNYCTDWPSDILLVHQRLISGRRCWVSVHPNTLIFLIVTSVDFVWPYCRPMQTP